MPKRKKYLTGTVGWDGYGSCFTQEDILYYLEDTMEEDEIEFVLISPGGGVTQGLTIASLIEQSPLDVSILAIEAQSIAVNILAAGTKGKRYASPEATIMIHLPWASPTGNKLELEKVIEGQQLAEDKMVAHLARRTDRDEAFWRTLIQSDNQQITPTEALEYGLIDAIVIPEGMDDERVVAARFKNEAIMAMQRNPQNKDMSLSNLIGRTKAKALHIALENGQTMYIDTPGSEANIGNAVSVDGKALADGEYEEKGGERIFVVRGSKIDDILTKTTEEVGEPIEAKALDMISGSVMQNQDAIKGLAETIKAQMNTVTGIIEERFTQMQEEIAALKEENEKIKALTTSTHETPALTETQGNANAAVPVSIPSYKSELARIQLEKSLAMSAKK